MQWEKREVEGERVPLQMERVDARCEHTTASRRMRFIPRMVSDRRAGLTFPRWAVFSTRIIASMFLDTVDSI